MFRTECKVLVLSLMAVAAVPDPGVAAAVPDLYVAQVPAKGLSGEPLDEAFALALDEVLVRVTGQRSFAADPGRRRSVGPAAPLVRQYQPVPGGQLRVSFDAAALRRRLDASNLPVWPDDRPRTLVILPADVRASAAPPTAGRGASTVPGVAAAAPLLSSRQLLLAAAASRGVPVILAPETVTGGRRTADPLLDPEATARAGGADLLLVGRRSPAGGPAVLRWTLALGSERAEWQGDPADGAHGLADRLAARYATAATSSTSLRLRIDGIDSFDSYGRLQGYLRSVGLVQSAELEWVTGSSMVFELGVRGDVNRLNDALALQRVLEPAGASAGGELIYRLMPGAVQSP